MAKFVKGISGNPAGRPRGIRDKRNLPLRKQIDELLVKYFKPEELAKDLKAMRPSARLMFLEKLLKYSIPVQCSTDVLLAGLSDEQLEEVYKRVTENLPER